MQKSEGQIRQDNDFNDNLPVLYLRGLARPSQRV